MVSYKALNTRVESTPFNTCDRVGDVDVRQSCAVIESLISNTCDRVGDVDVRQSCAVIVSIIS